MAVCIERTNRELVTQQVQHAGSEIKQRADAGVSLPVIIAERAFIVSAQISQTVVKPHQPVPAERLVQFKFSSLIIANRIHEAVSNAIGHRRTSIQSVYPSAAGEACLIS